MEVFLELTSEVVQLQQLEGCALAGVRAPLLATLPNKIVLIDSASMKELWSRELQADMGRALDCLYLPHQKAFLLNMSSSTLMLVPENSLQKKDFKQLHCPVPGRRLHLHYASKSALLVSSAGTVTRVTLDGTNFSAEAIKASKSKNSAAKKQELHGEVLDSICFDDHVGVLSLQGAAKSPDIKATPQKATRKRRASFDHTIDSDNQKWKFTMTMHYSEWTDESFEKINSAVFHTDISTSSPAPQWRIARHAMSNSVSIIIQTASTSAKWIKLSNEGVILFDRSIELPTPSSFPAAIIGRNDALVVVYCSSTQTQSDVSRIAKAQKGSKNVSDGRIELWNARYGIHFSPNATVIPFTQSSDSLCWSEEGNCHPCITIYNPMINNTSGMQTVVFGRRVGSGKKSTYEVLHYQLSSKEYPDLLLLDAVGSNSQGSLSAMLGKLAPSDDDQDASMERKTNSKKRRKGDEPSVDDPLFQAEYANDLSESHAVAMLKSALMEEDATLRIQNVRAISVCLAKRTQGFSSTILSDSIRRHLPANAAAVCMQVFSQLLYGICSHAPRGMNINESDCPVYDKHIEQVACWIESILDAHLSSFILGSQEVIDETPVASIEEEKPKTSKKKSKMNKKATEVSEPRVSLFRTAILTLLKALTQLETSQDMTEETLGLSCHIHRMLKARNLSNRPKEGQTSDSQATEGWSNSDLYQLEIIHY